MKSPLNEVKKQLKENASFDDVLKAEQTITKKDKDFIGLAFSGGGIRSATLNLGLLQGLASKNLLDRFDYLSTVSGGGYVGAFLSSLIARANGDISAVQQKLSADIEPEEINYLRKYSNYLTPKIGLSTDTMAAVSVWLTNTLLNQLVLISAIAAMCALGFFLNDIAIRLHDSDSITGILILGAILSVFSGYLAIKESIFSFQFSDYKSDKTQASTKWRTILAIGLAGVALISLWLTAKGMFSFLNLQPVTGVRLSPFWLINPAFIGLVCLGIIVTIGAAGRGGAIKLFNFKIFVSSFAREWWARLGGVTLYLCGLWLAGYFLVLYLPLLLNRWLVDHSLSAISVWGAVASGGAYLGRTPSTSGLGSINIKEKLTTILPWVVIASLIILVSFGVFKLAYSFYHSSYSMACVFLVLSAIFLSITLLFAWRVDVNIFSLHYFYRNRLTRAYLGAGNPKRVPSLFTGFDANDDIEFADCHHRPLHIVNTALNLTNAKDLAWQQRLAASFSFTPLYSGFELPNKKGVYQPTDEYAKGVKLGSIMAVSGAAACPNGGYHTAPATAFLMTMFNARLGRWYGNPIKSKWRNVSPAFGLGYLAKELLAKADVDSSYVYLSDGGHFENLGIYELVRRKCKLIIAVDAGQDGSYTFEDLGNAIRKCQVDLNITINIDVKDIHPSLQSQCGNFKHATKHYAIGEIIYDKANPKNNGLLLYIKNSLTGAEPTDLINFKLQQTAFPHHSTVDQFFDESQFESYRCLGQYIGNTVIEKLMKPSGLYERKAKTLLGI